MTLTPPCSRTAVTTGFKSFDVCNLLDSGPAVVVQRTSPELYSFHSFKAKPSSLKLQSNMKLDTVSLNIPSVINCANNAVCISTITTPEPLGMANAADSFLSFQKGETAKVSGFICMAESMEEREELQSGNSKPTHSYKQDAGSQNKHKDTPLRASIIAPFGLTKHGKRIHNVSSHGSESFFLSWTGLDSCILVAGRRLPALC